MMPAPSEREKRREEERRGEKGNCEWEQASAEGGRRKAEGGRRERMGSKCVGGKRLLQGWA